MPHTADLRRGQIVGDATRRWVDLNTLTPSYVAATYAPLASPNFTGDPKAPTPAPGDNDTSIATTAFVNTAVAAGHGISGLTAGQLTIAGSATTITTSIAYGTTGNNTIVETGATGVLAAGVMPAYTGDVTSPAGSTVNTLANVNANVGTFQGITVDAKGRVTAATNQGYLQLTGGTMSGPLIVNAAVSAQNFFVGAQGTGDSGTFGFGNSNGPAIVFYGSAATGVGSLQFFTAGTKAFQITSNQYTTFSAPVELSNASAITPQNDNNCYCGSPTLAWYQVNAHAYATISDPAQKTDIAPVPAGALAQVQAIRPCTYHWKSDEPTSPLHWGFMAPEVRQVMGSVFAGAMQDKDSGVLRLSYNDLTAVLWRAVQELAAEVAALKEK